MSSQENLKASQLFAGFGDDEIAAFVDAGVRRSVPADHVFFRMGDLNSALFIVCAGSVKVDRLGTADDVPLTTLEAGQTFGEMSFMDGSRTTAAVTATEPTEVLEILRETVSAARRQTRLGREAVAQFRARPQATSEQDQRADRPLRRYQSGAARQPGAWPILRSAMTTSRVP